MDDSYVAVMPNSTFAEYLVVTSVAELAEGTVIEDLAKELTAAMILPGVLDTHVGPCEPMLGADHTFLIHIRAVDTASCHAAYGAASKVYETHCAADHVGDMIVVDFESNAIGAWDVKWPAVRVAIFKYKPDIPERSKESLIQTLRRLPTLFPSVKQVSWGKNVARERAICRETIDSADLGVILGFSTCHDMYALGGNAKYWELLNYHGISRLELYEVLTFCGGC